MVTVGKVVHLLELLVNDANAGLVGAVGDLLDILGALAHLGQLLVDDLGGLNGGLGVEFGLKEVSYLVNSLTGGAIAYQGRKP